MPIIKSQAIRRRSELGPLLLLLVGCLAVAASVKCSADVWPAGLDSADEDGPAWRALEQRRQQQQQQSDEEQPDGEQVFLLEDKDYPRSLFEDYSRRVGQVSGITALPSDNVVIFHRAERQWTNDTFMPRLSAAASQAELNALEERLINNDTLMVIERDNGNELASFGAGLFYMPHSVASDSLGNLWVSDTGRHQVMRLPVAGLLLGGERAPSSASLAHVWPDLVLGEPFTPGSGPGQFCQPTEIAVSSDGRLVYVADGYCNARVAVFSGSGQFVASFGEQQNMRVVHSLALIEQRNLICVADRDNARVLCYSAGLGGRLGQLGQLRVELDYPIGRVYALASIGRDHLLVSSSQPESNRYDLAILNPFTRELKLVWTSSDLLEPHSLACTNDRQYAYAADVSRDAFKKVFKFNIISRS